jgi:C-terminal processing protease CtpA/Prc
MVRQLFAVAFVLVLAAAGVVRAGDEEDREALREKILKKVEERLKSENKRIMDEVKKILDEELSKMDEEDEGEEDPPKKKPDPKPKPKPDPDEEEEGGEPGYMGITPDDLDDGMRELLKLKDGEGVMVMEVMPGGPASKGGLKANDIVLTVDGKKVGTSEALREAIQSHGAGESVKLTVLRKTKKVDLKVKLVSLAELSAGPEEGEEEDEEEEEEEEKPTKKPKVVFEPRAEAPRYDEMTEKELRERTRKLLDELLKEGKEEPAPKAKKSSTPRAWIEIRWEDEDAPEAEKGHDLRELTKRFLRDLLERMEEEDAMEEEEQAPFGDMDDELKELVEKFQEFRGEEMEKLKERFQEQMEKLGNDEFFRKMLEGMDPKALQDQLQRLLGGLDGDEEDEELPEAEKDPQPLPAPKTGRAWLGVTPEDLPEEMKSQLNLETGVLIGAVSEGSPAEAAGLKEGDVLLELDGKAVTGPEQLRTRLGALKAGTEVKLTIQRKGKRIEKTATLAVRKKISVEPTWEPIGDKRAKKSKKAEKKEECQEPCCREKRAKAAKKKSANRKVEREEFRFEFDAPEGFRKFDGRGIEEAHKALRKALGDRKFPGEARKAIEKALRDHKLHEVPRELGKKFRGERHFEFDFKDADKWLKKARGEFEKALKEKGLPQRDFKQPRKKAQRKVILETEEPGRKARKLVIDPDDLRHEGEDLRKELERARKSLEEMLKEKKGTPKELREEMEDLRDWLEKMQKPAKKKKKSF